MEKISACVTVERANHGHIEDLKWRLSSENERECESAVGMTANEALEFGFKHSIICQVVLKDQSPVLIFGAMIGKDKVGSFWLLHTKELLDIKFVAIKYSKYYVQKILAYVPVLESYIYERNYLTRRWAKWCGFTPHPLAPFGMKGELFQRFTIERQVV